MRHGTVTFFDATHRYGFITVEGLDYSVFVHVSAMAAPSVPVPQVGQRVAFDLVTDLHAPRAVNVRLVPSSWQTPHHRGPRSAGSRGQGGPLPGPRSARSLRLHPLRPARGAGRETTGNGQHTEQTGHQHTLTRVLDAPVATVWESWTQPRHLARWLSVPLRFISLDMRPGGTWWAIMVAPDGTEHPLSGSYREVIQQRRLVYTVPVPDRAQPAVFDITFTDLGDHTRVVLTLTGVAGEERRQAKAGSVRVLDGFSAYLTTV